MRLTVPVCRGGLVEVAQHSAEGPPRKLPRAEHPEGEHAERGAEHAELDLYTPCGV